MPTVTSPDPAATIESVLRAAAGVTGMEVVFLSELSPTTFTFTRVLGDAFPGVTEGTSMPRADSFCARMLAGAPPMTSAAASEGAYADSPLLTDEGISSYIGVPVLTAAAGIIGTLCGIDHGTVPLGPDALAVLRALADVIALVSDNAPTVRLRRTVSGWQVEPIDGQVQRVDDLTEGMSLADLLSENLSVATRPKHKPDDVDETDKLRTQVSQLEHALSARVVVEQAIGVLAERQGVPPREAFERLRRVARRRGQRVHDLARTVVSTVVPPADDPGGPREQAAGTAEAALPSELR